MKLTDKQIVCTIADYMGTARFSGYLSSLDALVLVIRKALKPPQVSGRQLYHIASDALAGARHTSKAEHELLIPPRAIAEALASAIREAQEIQTKETR